MASSGQLQANAYCDSPDVVLVGMKADLRDTRDVHARQARDLADRYGCVIHILSTLIRSHIIKINCIFIYISKSLFWYSGKSEKKDFHQFTTRWCCCSHSCLTHVC